MLQQAAPVRVGGENAVVLLLYADHQVFGAVQPHALPEGFAALENILQEVLVDNADIDTSVHLRRVQTAPALDHVVIGKIKLIAAGHRDILIDPGVIDGRRRAGDLRGDAPDARHLHDGLQVGVGQSGFHGRPGG